MASFSRGLCVIVLSPADHAGPGVAESMAAQTSGPFPFPDYTAVDYTQIPIQETGVVDVVADGDTIRFIPDGASDYVTVRLLGINTPEVRGFYNQNRSEDMCGAVAATESALHAAATGMASSTAFLEQRVPWIRRPPPALRIRMEPRHRCLRHRRAGSYCCRGTCNVVHGGERSSTVLPLRRPHLAGATRPTRDLEPGVLRAGRATRCLDSA